MPDIPHNLSDSFSRLGGRQRWSYRGSMILRLFNVALDRFQRFRLPGDEYARWKGVTVGKGCRIITHSFGTEPFLIEIGDKVTVTASVTFLTHDGATWLLRDVRGRRQHYARIKIGSECFIGYGSIIMPGVEIGDRVVVGAGSVVTKSIPSGCVVAGNPAKFICSFDDWASRPFKHDADKQGDDYETQVLSILSRSPRPLLTDYS